MKIYALTSEMKKLTNRHQITFASILCLRNVLFSILHHSTTSLQSLIWMSKESGTEATMFRILRTVLAVLAFGIVAKKSPLLFSNVNTSPNCFDSVCILASLREYSAMSGKNADNALQSQRILSITISAKMQLLRVSPFQSCRWFYINILQNEVWGRQTLCCCDWSLSKNLIANYVDDHCW